MIEKIKNLLKDKEKMDHYIRYFVVGVITTVIGWIMYKVFRVLMPTVDENICNILSIVVAMISAYFMNRKFVFKSEEKNIVKEFSTFITGRIFCAVVEELYFFMMIEFTEINDMIIKMTASAIALVINYVISRFIVFKDTMDKVDNK